MSRNRSVMQEQMAAVVFIDIRYTRDTIARAIYVAAVEKCIVVVRVFTKKSRKTSRREIETALEDEFALANQFIRARGEAGLTQQELAKRMKTSQAFIARLEGGKETPSTRTLNRFAKATGHRVVTNFEPLAGQ